MRSRIRSRRFVATLVALVMATACVDGTDPVGPVLPPAFSLALAPRFAVAPSDEAVGDLSLARVVLTEVSTGDTLALREIDLDPEAEAWILDVSFVAPTLEPFQVIFTVELLARFPDGTPSVEWSGRSASITLMTGSASSEEAREVDLFRGPLDNLEVTGVALQPVGRELLTGESVRLESVLEGGGEGTRVFYASLDPEVLTVSSAGLVEALGVGLARVEAMAGPAADTMEVEITELVLPPAETVAEAQGSVDDSGARLAPSLEDAAGAQAIEDALDSLSRSWAQGRGGEALNAIREGRSALESYGTAELRFKDGPQLSLIGLTLDFMERLILAATASGSPGR